MGSASVIAVFAGCWYQSVRSPAKDVIEEIVHSTVTAILLMVMGEWQTKRPKLSICVFCGWRYPFSNGTAAPPYLSAHLFRNSLDFDRLPARFINFNHRAM